MFICLDSGSPLLTWQGWRWGWLAAVSWEEDESTVS